MTIDLTGGANEAIPRQRGAAPHLSGLGVILSVTAYNQ